jgi:hypothetical protein
MCGKILEIDDVKPDGAHIYHRASKTLMNKPQWIL